MQPSTEELMVQAGTIFEVVKVKMDPGVRRDDEKWEFKPMGLLDAFCADARMCPGSAAIWTSVALWESR